MKITIGSDHAGFRLKEHLHAYFTNLGVQITDVGCSDESPVDYPDFAAKVCESVLRLDDARGIVICGSGVGASVAANKHVGIRAATCHDTYSAHQGVEHDDMNVLVLGSRVIGVALAEEICAAFVKAKFSSEDRHVRRLNKIKAIESRMGAKS